MNVVGTKRKLSNLLQKQQKSLAASKDEHTWISYN